jgi:hypothetical protein
VRGGLRTLLPRLHLLPALSAIAVIGPRSAADVDGAVESVGADADVIVLDARVDVLEELRASVGEPNVSYLVSEADVLPLPDHSVGRVVAYVSLPAEEIARVTLNLEQ